MTVGLQAMPTPGQVRSAARSVTSLRASPCPGTKLVTVASIDDSGVRELLEQPNYAVISTANADGSIHSAVIWIGLDDEGLTVNSAAGRIWPANLGRDPRVTIVVFEASNPYEYVEVRGRASATTDGADDHIDRLTKKYIGQDTYPYRQPGEQRTKFLIAPDHVRHVKM
jgi:PPOX class probable F420-dependent enzyme